MQAQQICVQACYEAKAQIGMVAQAGFYLNTVLEDLVLNRNLKINRVTQVISVAAGTYGPFNLEADYLRTYDMFYPIPTFGGQIGTLTQFLNPVTMEQWDSEFKDPSMSNYPYEFATDLSVSPGTFVIYPMSSGVISVTHRYMKKQADITSPETSSATPWFPFTDYLICATAARLMGVTGDDRREEYFNRAEHLLFPYLIQEGDEQQTVRAVRLDPRHFRTVRSVRPTKANPM